MSNIRRLRCDVASQGQGVKDWGLRSEVYRLHNWSTNIASEWLSKCTWRISSKFDSHRNPPTCALQSHKSRVGSTSHRSIFYLIIWVFSHYYDLHVVTSWFSFSLPISRSALFAAVLITALVHCSHIYDTCNCYRSPLWWWQRCWGALATTCGHPSLSPFLLVLIYKPYAMLIATLCAHDHMTCKFLILVSSLRYHTYVQLSTGPFALILLNVDTLSNLHCSGWSICCWDYISGSYMYVMCLG
jgi:hypothetical protein